MKEFVLVSALSLLVGCDSFPLALAPVEPRVDQTKLAPGSCPDLSAPGVQKCIVDEASSTELAKDGVAAEVKAFKHPNFGLTPFVSFHVLIRNTRTHAISLQRSTMSLAVDGAVYGPEASRLWQVYIDEKAPVPTERTRMVEEMRIEPQASAKCYVYIDIDKPRLRGKAFTLRIDSFEDIQTKEKVQFAVKFISDW